MSLFEIAIILLLAIILIFLFKIYSIIKIELSLFRARSDNLVERARAIDKNIALIRGELFIEFGNERNLFGRFNLYSQELKKISKNTNLLSIDIEALRAFVEAKMLAENKEIVSSFALEDFHKRRWEALGLTDDQIENLFRQRRKKGEPKDC